MKDFEDYFEKQTTVSYKLKENLTEEEYNVLLETYKSVKKQQKYYYVKHKNNEDVCVTSISFDNTGHLNIDCWLDTEKPILYFNDYKTACGIAKRLGNGDEGVVLETNYPEFHACTVFQGSVYFGED